MRILHTAGCVHLSDLFILAYINFLQVGKLVLVPQLGIAEDEQALLQIADAMPRCKVVGVPALEAVRKGGAMNCISWNVATSQWNRGFMAQSQKSVDDCKV